MQELIVRILDASKYPIENFIQIKCMVSHYGFSVVYLYFRFSFFVPITSGVRLKLGFRA